MGLLVMRLGLSLGFASMRILPARLLFAACIGLACTPLLAQTYPSKPVKLVVPFAAGGGNDVFARVLGQKLSEQWKQAVVIENRPGAGGNIGADFVAKAAPDGYTLLLGHTGTLAINPGLYSKMPYDAVKDFAPIAQFATAPLVLVTGTHVDARTLHEVVALARAREMTFSSGGAGTGAHLTGELFKSALGLKLLHVPYKGTVPAMTDVIGGQVHMMFSVIPPVLQHIRSGKLRAIAVTSAARTAMLPEVPAVGESGHAAIESTLSYGIVAPAGTPEAIVRETQAQIAKAAASPDFKERLASEGTDPMFATGAAFAAVLQAETRKWAAVIKAAGVRAD